MIISNYAQAEDFRLNRNNSSMEMGHLLKISPNDKKSLLETAEHIDEQDDLMGLAQSVLRSQTNSAGGSKLPPTTASVDEACEMESDMPFISESVYQRLPLFLKDLCKTFKSPRKRDVFLTSVLGVLSGCFDKVSGQYAGDRVHANLYMFIVAPAASGKGSMVWAKRLAEPLNQEWKKLKNEEDSGYKLLLISGNNSAAGFVAGLNQNGGIGIMIETEADTLANSFQQDWGNFSDLLRKAYHHESISLNRKKEHVEIDKPRLSVVLTGTLGQIVGIIPSAENGLLSRFSFYNYNSMEQWDDVSPAAQNSNREELFGKTGKWFAEKAMRFSQRPIEFSLTESQWEELNHKYEKLLKQTQTELGPEAQGIVKRSGLMVFRLAMVLSTARRLMHETKWEEEIVCTEADFRSAIELAEIFKQHSVNTFKMLPNKDRLKMNASQRELLAALPNGDLFTRAEAVSVGDGLNFSESSVDKYLADLFEKGYLVRERQKGEGRKYRKN